MFIYYKENQTPNYKKAAFFEKTPFKEISLVEHSSIFNSTKKRIFGENLQKSAFSSKHLNWMNIITPEKTKEFNINKFQDKNPNKTFNSFLDNNNNKNNSIKNQNITTKDKTKRLNKIFY